MIYVPQGRWQSLSPIACMGVLLYRSAKPLESIDMLRIIFGGLLMLSVAACKGAADLQDAPAPLGDFKLGHNIVVAPKVQKGPLSRNASKEELTTALQAAIAERFDRYDGEKLYHFGVSVEGYVLAAPGAAMEAAVHYSTHLLEDDIDFTLLTQG